MSRFGPWPRPLDLPLPGPLVPLTPLTTPRNTPSSPSPSTSSPRLLLWSYILLIATLALGYACNWTFLLPVIKSDKLLCYFILWCKESRNGGILTRWNVNELFFTIGILCPEFCFNHFLIIISIIINTFVPELRLSTRPKSVQIICF